MALGAGRALKEMKTLKNVLIDMWSLLTRELPGNQIEHKLFGCLTNQLLGHFVKFLMSSVEYYLACR